MKGLLVGTLAILFLAAIITFGIREFQFQDTRENLTIANAEVAKLGDDLAEQKEYSTRLYKSREQAEETLNQVLSILAENGVSVVGEDMTIDAAIINGSKVIRLSTAESTTTIIFGAQSIQWDPNTGKVEPSQN